MELPDFEKMADEIMADAASESLPLRDLVVSHGRLMFAQGVRAAKDMVLLEVDAMLDVLAEEAESGPSLTPEPAREETEG